MWLRLLYFHRPNATQGPEADAKPTSDAELLRRAQASSTRRQNRLAKQSRAEAADRESRRAEPG